MDGDNKRNRPATSSHIAIPLAPLPDSVAARVQQAAAPGATDRSGPVRAGLTVLRGTEGIRRRKLGLEVRHGASAATRAPGDLVARPAILPTRFGGGNPPLCHRALRSVVDPPQQRGGGRIPDLRVGFPEPDDRHRVERARDASALLRGTIAVTRRGRRPGARARARPVCGRGAGTAPRDRVGSGRGSCCSAPPRSRRASAGT